MSFPYVSIPEVERDIETLEPGCTLSTTLEKLKTPLFAVILFPSRLHPVQLAMSAAVEELSLRYMLFR